MNNWFEWNGTKSTKYGVIVTDNPSITLPIKRTSSVSVLGRPGKLTIEEGDDVYDEVTLTCKCYVSDLSKLPDIAGWLTGYGLVRFANRSDGVYEAYVNNQIAFEKVLRGNSEHTLSVNFKCSPLFIPDYTTLKNVKNGAYIENPYTITARPIITVVLSKKCDVAVTIDGITVTVADVASGTLIIDTDAMLTKKSTGANKCPDTTLELDKWPALAPGKSTISWTGDGISSVSVDPNWRCL